MIDVLVVGGGPAGLATAISCALSGLSVTVAEPRAAPVDKACGEGLMPSAVRRLDALGVSAEPLGRRLRGIRYTDGEHQADALFRHGSGIGVRRTALHTALSARAAALGIPVLPERVAAGSVIRQDDRVIAGGIEARYLVAADGLHSAIRRGCESGAAGAAQPSGRVTRRPDGRLPAAPRRGDAVPARYGLRRHYQTAPWTDLVEVHWARGAEAYVTPVDADTVGVAVLFSPERQGDGRDPAGLGDSSDRGGGGGAFEARLAAFPALRERLAGAAPASEVRGAGPLRQQVSRRVYGRVLLVGDASGYLDALTGEGIGVALAQAGALASCLAAGRPDDYERAWRRASGPAWRLTAGLLWSRNQPLLARLIVPAAVRLPWLFRTLVNHAAQA